MRSYPHSFYAGNLADVHKHSTLAWILSYLIRKDKPVTYIDTHSGRGLYNLSSVAAIKTGEADQGILRPVVQSWFPSGHPYQKVLAKVRAAHGQSAYPGSPTIAQSFLRPIDTIHLAELHPAEAKALSKVVANTAHVHTRDGFEMANAICPPMPRRGLMLIDPSYELQTDYDQIPKFLKRTAERWEVGILVLCYPLLAEPVHESMLQRLQQLFPDAINHQVEFPATQAGHGMVGSGLFLINSPYGLNIELVRLARCYQDAFSR